MFSYFPSNPLKGLITTKFFAIWRFPPLFLLFIISFTSWNLKLQQPRNHLRKVLSWKVVVPHSPKNLQILLLMIICCLTFFTICDLQATKTVFLICKLLCNQYSQNLSFSMLVALKNTVKTSVIFLNCFKHVPINIFNWWMPKRFYNDW